LPGTCFDAEMLISPSEALRRVLEAVVPFPSEDWALSSAEGRILRRDLLTDRALPPYDRVTMDGYAVRSGPGFGLPSTNDGRLTLRVDRTPQMAGMIARTLPEGEGACIEIMTGAVLPHGTDCVAPYEDTVRDGATIALSAEAASRLRPGTNVHRAGSDSPAGAVAVKAGTRLTGREIAVAAACGHATVLVSSRPRLAVVSTGDELVEIGSEVGPHQIRRSNDLALRAALIQAGYPNVECVHFRDVPLEIEEGLRRLLAGCDAIVVTGGVSKGRHDHIPGTLAALGVAPLFHGVSQRPGKPLWFGLSVRGQPVFALPGNPVACYTCLHRYVLPALARASGRTVGEPRWVSLAQASPALAKLTSFLPVRLRSTPDGRQLAEPDPFNTSGDFAGLVETDGFVELPPRPDAYPAGTPVEFTAWT